MPDLDDPYLDTMPAVNETMLREVGNDMMDENAEGHLWKRAMGPAWTGKSILKTNKLKSQVSAMQLTVTGLNSVLYVCQDFVIITTELYSSALLTKRKTTL